MRKTDSAPRRFGENPAAVSSFPASRRREAGASDGPSAGENLRTPRVLAITGGKGGVGKTSIALNLGLVLSRMGKRVLLLDGDTDLANVNIMLGRYPRHTLEHVIAGECTMREVVLSVNHGLHIVPGASGVQRCIEMTAHDRHRILATLGRIERDYDYVLVDTAAGLQASALHMIAAAAMACVVITPDPTSLTDAFSLLKVLNRRGYRRNPGIVVNMARGASQAQSVFRRFSAATQRYIGLKPEYLGAIWRDEAIAQSVTTQRPVGLLDSSDPSCRQFWSLAEMLDMRLDRKALPGAGFAAYWERLARKQDSRSAQPSREQPEPAAPDSASTPNESASHGDTEAPATAKPDGLARVEQQWSAWTEQLRGLMDNPETTPVQRYQALTLCMELLGRDMDDDLVEVLQTGLAAMDWDRLPVSQRAHFAAHLRQLADQVEPPLFDKPPAKSDTGPAFRKGPDTTPAPGEGPRAEQPAYDEAAFGSQELLLSRLRSQPESASINDILKSFGYQPGENGDDSLADTRARSQTGSIGRGKEPGRSGNR